MKNARNCSMSSTELICKINEWLVGNIEMQDLNTSPLEIKVSWTIRT